ncbi:MAG TPA: hypothetical protein VFL13_14865 [Candidatus Baltobacteraceae bacterium]|nr:hypothetical protein [Candidatus Baltobacteraceae bacterium]
MKILRTSLALAALVGSFSLAACGGGGGTGSTLPVSGGNGGNSQSLTQQTEDSVDTANAVGSPMKDISNYNDTMSAPGTAQFAAKGSKSTDTVGDGSCNNGVEFFAPDKAGDPNSTERIDFYDNGCTQIARDAVRVVSSTGSGSENVARTVNLYALNGTSPEAVRSESVAFSNAQFDRYGYPVLSAGFDRTHSGNLTINGVRTIDGDGELVVAPSANSVTTFCSDSAGFNATGDSNLNETFGWQGMNPSGTRTVNSDNSVTWALTRTGTAYTGAIGGLTIQTGAQNTSCPISTPMFTLAGGTAKGSYNIPISATYKQGILSNLTISNASLVNGDTLNVTTNSSLPPSDPHFISGTLTNGSNNVSTFNVDAFGDGTLVVAKNGKAYQIVDWHVVKASS